MSDLITIAQEPTGVAYAALLEFARLQGSLFSLVWRDQLQFDATAADVAAALEPDLVTSRCTDRWPGTVMVDTLATVNLYRLSQRALAIVSAAPGLYSWCSPGRPEDLALYSSDLRPWLGSIAHEADSFLYAAAVDLEALRAAVPGLVLDLAP